jgi:hypothetical protein
MKFIYIKLVAFVLMDTACLSILHYDSRECKLMSFYHSSIW